MEPGLAEPAPSLAERVESLRFMAAHELAHDYAENPAICSPLSGTYQGLVSPQGQVRTSLPVVTALDELTRVERFARNIRLARALADMTQAALADRLGIQRHHLSRYEHGKVEPRATNVERLEKLAEVFELPDWSWFYEGHPELESALSPETRERFRL